MKLTVHKAAAELGWTPRLCLKTAIEWLVDGYKTWQAAPAVPQAIRKLILAQIRRYESLL